MPRQYAPVKVFLGTGVRKIPRGAVIDNSSTLADDPGSDGFTGHVGSELFTITTAVLAGGFRFATDGGSFNVIGSGTADPVADFKWTCVRVFDNGEEEETKFSASPSVDISSLSWSGFAGSKFDRPVLLTPGTYRMDFSATLSEDYEFNTTIPDTTWVIVGIQFEPHYFTGPDGVAYVGLNTFTDYNLTTGASGKTNYEWPDDMDEPPLAVDITTYRMNLIDWCAYLLARGIPGVPHEHRRSYLHINGYIEDGGVGAVSAGGMTWGQALNRTNQLNGHEAGGGAFTEQQTIKQAIMRILFEMRCALDWTSFKSRIIVIPDFSVSSARTITLDDIERESPDNPIPKLNVTYTTEDECINTIDARYKRDYSLAQGQRTAYQSSLSRREDSASVTAIGRQFDESKFFYDWIVDSTHADDVTSAWRTHLGSPKKIVEFEGFMNLLELQRGDFISFNLTPTITIGETVGEADENQELGDGGWGGAGFGGTQITPTGTIKGEAFDGLTSSIEFMVEQVQVNWTARRIRVRAREVP